MHFFFLLKSSREREASCGKVLIPGRSKKLRPRRRLFFSQEKGNKVTESRRIESQSEDLQSVLCLDDRPLFSSPPFPRIPIRARRSTRWANVVEVGRAAKALTEQQEQEHCATKKRRRRLCHRSRRRSSPRTTKSNNSNLFSRLRRRSAPSAAALPLRASSLMGS